jgi:hypothetical protein
VGVSGALLAWLISETFSWRTSYFIGGALGLALLCLRIGVAESGMFSHAKETGVTRGDFFSLFTHKDRLKRFLSCVAVGVPIWFIIGILITLSPEFAVALGIDGPVSAGRAVMFAYSGLIVGDLASGLLSQLLRSRKKVAFAFISLCLLGVIYYFQIRNWSPDQFYRYCFLLGFFAGYWAIFVTIGAEQFGTNLRATVATSVPNFVRGSLVLISALFTLAKTQWGLLNGGLAVGLLCCAVAFLGLWKISESFGQSLDYLEE